MGKQQLFHQSKLLTVFVTNTAQKMKFSIKDFFSKCDQIRSFLRIWSHLLKESLIENFIFYVAEMVKLLDFHTSIKM